MKIIVLWFFLLFSLHADETLTELFEQLKTVSKEEKFTVVNEIKKHIIQLKQQERIEAIKVLKAKKEAEVKASSSEMMSETVADVAESDEVEAAEPMVSSEEQMTESMEEMKDVKDMKMPENMQNMEQMPNMQNMATMKNMPLMKNIKVRKDGGTPSPERMQEMMGNR